MTNKRKYPKSQLHGIIVSIFADNPFKAYNNKQIASKLGIKDKAGKNLIYTILNELLVQGVLREMKKGKFILHADKLKTLANKKKYITGTVELKKTGKAYILSDEGGDHRLQQRASCAEQRPCESVALPKTKRTQTRRSGCGNFGKEENKLRRYSRVEQKFWFCGGR